FRQSSTSCVADPPAPRWYRVPPAELAVLVRLAGNASSYFLLPSCRTVRHVVFLSMEVATAARNRESHRDRVARQQPHRQHLAWHAGAKPTDGSILGPSWGGLRFRARIGTPRP